MTLPTAVVIGFLVVALIWVFGALLFALATAKARVFPSWTGWAVLLAALLSLASGLLAGVSGGLLSAVVGRISTVLLSVALIWIGYQLMRPSPGQTLEVQRA